MRAHFCKICEKKRFYLYFSVVAAICICVALLSAQSGGITAKDPKAKEMMDAALKALGGADKIGGIKSLVIKGTRVYIPIEGTVSPTGDPRKTSDPAGFEIRILLPDSILQIDHPRGDGVMQGQGISFTNYRGISGGTLIPQIQALGMPTVMPGGKVVMDDPIKKSKQQPTVFDKYNESVINHTTNNRKDEWARFLTGTLMKAGADPLTLSTGPKPGIFTLTKKDGDLGEIEFDPKTGYPSVIRYKNVDPFTAATADLPSGAKPPVLVGGFASGAGSGGSSGGAFPSGGQGTGQADYGVMRFQDHFSVNGIMFPKIITKPMLGDTTEELCIEEVLINPGLTLKDFESPSYVPNINIRGAPKR